MMMEEDAHSIEGSLLCFSDFIETPSSIRSSNFVGVQTTSEQSKYAQLLAVIEEMGRDIRPSYAGSKSSVERLKRGIVHSKVLIRECLIENERHAK